MGDIGEMYRDMREMHKERVEKTPERIEYAIQQFKDNDIRYELKNPAIGHFHCWRKSDGKLYQFWAGTGKILGYRNRGIKLLIKELLK
jgi:glutamine synthetase